ncbi:MAG: polymorphic toxin type 15 domain-containing protein [Pseudomonadota bacterium]
MSFDVDDTGRIWSKLQRKEDELKWGGQMPGFGPRHDSMGRPANSSSHFAAGWSHQQMGRVNRVRMALRDSGPMAQRMVEQTLSGINLSSIWHILIATCEDIALYYGGSVVAGGLIGGVGGAFAGGVGAIPGVAVGAAAGGVVGGWVLALLGLKSLITGVAQAIPDALRYYEKGFLEAWGPTRQNSRYGFSSDTRGDPSSAAFLLANGHVLMVSAILSVLAAYVMKGKGDMSLQLKDIRGSGRLGPKVARWVEENQDKLRQQFGQRTRGHGTIPPEAAPPPKRRREPEEERKPERPNGMPQKRVPCFKTNGLPQGSVPEFDRQLAGQEAGINKMTVEEYVNGRDAFDSRKSMRDQKIARNARADYQTTLGKKLTRQYQAEGFSPQEAKQKAAAEAAEKMKTLAALHNPDMVAGGKDVISDFGDRNINSRIGAQWKKGERLAELDKAANDVMESMGGKTKMNAKLERCR